MENFVPKCMPGNEKGFTLVEALVAMGIFSIVMLATASMLFTGMSASVTGNGRFIASCVTQGFVDDLMKRPFNSVVTFVPAQATDTAAGRLSTVEGRSFRTRWTVVNLGTDPANPVMRQFSVTTTWTDNAGGHAVTITGLRAP